MPSGESCRCMAVYTRRGAVVDVVLRRRPGRAVSAAVRACVSTSSTFSAQAVDSSAVHRCACSASTKEQR
jgi:hypothetical protein